MNVELYHVSQLDKAEGTGGAIILLLIFLLFALLYHIDKVI